MTFWSFARLIWSDPGFIKHGVDYNPDKLTSNDLTYWNYVNRHKYDTQYQSTGGREGTLVGSIKGNENNPQYDIGQGLLYNKKPWGNSDVNSQRHLIRNRKYISDDNHRIRGTESERANQVISLGGGSPQMIKTQDGQKIGTEGDIGDDG